jgi:hypothetical protein
VSQGIDLHPCHRETVQVAREGTAGRFLWLLLIALWMGWCEVAVVVYLRELYYPNGFRFPVVLVPPRIAAVEMAREAAAILVLAGAARLAGRAFLERFAAFAVLFGVWDLCYYAGLRLVLGWPSSLAEWDVLFLIPVPWLGPVWAPCVVSIALFAAGAYLYWTPERTRRYGTGDWLAAIAGGLLVIGAFTADWRALVEQRLPRPFPAWLFWLGLATGLAAFLRAERRRA